MAKLKIAFAGTPEIALPSLKFLTSSKEVDLVSIIAPISKPSGRGNKLKDPETVSFAKENKVPYIQTSNINKSQDSQDILKTCDLLIVFAFSQFLSEKTLNSAKLGCFNIHTSILPQYRGAAPIQYAILNGDKKTGVTIQKMVKKMDAGDIVVNKEIEIEAHETSKSLHDKLMSLSATALEDFIKVVLNDSLEFTPQDEKNVSFAPTIKKEDGYIDFQNIRFDELDRKRRAYFPWPGIFCYLDNKRLKVLDFEKSKQTLQPGGLSFKLNTFDVGLKDSTIRLTQIQLEGKKACNDTELLNGLRNSKSEPLLNKQERQK